MQVAVVVRDGVIESVEQADPALARPVGVKSPTQPLWRRFGDHDIFMPALSSTMTEGKIVEWLKKPEGGPGRVGARGRVRQGRHGHRVVQRVDAGWQHCPCGRDHRSDRGDRGEIAEAEAKAGSGGVPLRLPPLLLQQLPHPRRPLLRHLRLLLQSRLLRPWLQQHPLRPFQWLTTVAWWPAPERRNWRLKWASICPAFAVADPMAESRPKMSNGRQVVRSACSSG